MTERLEAMTARQYKDRNGETKTAWSRIGTAWATAKGWSITFDALPLPSLNDKGVLETRVLLMPPREDNRSGANAPARSPGVDDEVPFTSEWR